MARPVQQEPREIPGLLATPDEQAKRAATAFQALPASRESRDPREFRDPWARAAA